MAAPGTDPVAPRKLRRDAERNRERIIAAAREVFADRGMAATLDDVAHHAGVGVGTVYRRFPDKETLLAASFQDLLAALVALAQDALGQDGAWAGLRLFLHRSAEMQSANRGLRDLALHSNLGGEPMADLREQLVPLLTRLVDRAKAEGSLRPDASAEDIPLLMFMISEVGHHTGGARSSLSVRYLDLFLDGLRNSGSMTPLGPPPVEEDIAGFARRLMPRRGPHPPAG